MPIEAAREPALAEKKHPDSLKPDKPHTFETMYGCTITATSRAILEDASGEVRVRDPARLKK